jgi:hypothetical protein
MKIVQIPVPEGHGNEQLKRLAAYLPECCLFQGPWLAGGTVRRMVENERVDSADLDYFFPDSTTWYLACEKVERVADAVLSTDQAHTYRVPLPDGHQIVQLIKIAFHDNLVDLMRSFDFRACQFFSDGKSIVYPEKALDDVKHRRLRLAFKGELHTDGLFARLHKYTNYGFRPDPGLILAVMKTLSRAGLRARSRMSDARTYSDSEPKDDPTGLGPRWRPLEPKEKVL